MSTNNAKALTGSIKESYKQLDAIRHLVEQKSLPKPDVLAIKM